MKKILFSLFTCLPLVIIAQGSTNKNFSYTTISSQENGGNAEFHDNYTKGIGYYNQGVETINKIEPNSNDDASKKTTIQANAQFKMALAYLLKAYDLNPKNENILKALQGAYFKFNDMKDSDRYKNELESLKK